MGTRDQSLSTTKGRRPCCSNSHQPTRTGDNMSEEQDPGQNPYGDEEILQDDEVEQ